MNELIIKTNYYHFFSEISEKTYKSRGVPNLENEISFIKPNQKVVNLNPDTKIKCGPPKATSTIKQQPITQYISMYYNIMYKIELKT